PGAAPAAPPPRPAPSSGISLPDAFNALNIGSGPIRRGRVSVIADSVSNRGWIAKSRVDGYYEVTPQANQALIVEYSPAPSGRPVDFRLLDSLPESNFDRLVRGPADEGMLSSKTGHAGPADTTVWSITQDGTIAPVWKTDAQS
ncbi:hypothetical protein FRC00_002936, partial [Tulasnella sp. 408]